MRDWEVSSYNNALKNIQPQFATLGGAMGQGGQTLVNYMAAPQGAKTFTSADLGR